MRDQMNFFTADTHFFHRDLLLGGYFSPRNQFLTVDMMNETIIANWNAHVKPTDTVYHLGDIAMLFEKPAKQVMADTIACLRRLNGQIVIVKGNHDTAALLKYLLAHNEKLSNGQPKFSTHEVGVRMKFAHYEVFLTHYPLLFGITPNKINLHGHIHNASVHHKENINVGIDSPDRDYLPADSVPFGAPLSEAEVIDIILSKRRDYNQRQ